MRRRIAIGALIVTLGWVTTSVALQQAPGNSTEPDADASARVIDPFEQFDLGVASLAETSTVLEWTPLKTSGLRLIPEEVVVAAGQTIDSLLLERGVRPDPYSRSVVAEINPVLSDDFSLVGGQTVTLFRIAGRGEEHFIGGLIALQPFQAERETVRTLLAQIDEVQNTEARALVSWRQLLVRVEQAEKRATLTNRAQIIEAGAVLASYNSDFTSALDSLDGSQFAQQAQYAAVASGTNAAVAAMANLEDDTRPASLRVRVSSEGVSPTGVCEIGWAPLGFAPYTASRVYEEYRGPVVIRVPASDLHVWVARSQDEPGPATLRIVRKAQLISGVTHPMTIPARGACEE